MTREEAIKIIDDECKHIKHHLTQKGKAEEFYIELGNMVIAFNMAIKLLKQEPCENAISRQAALKCFTWTNDKADIWNRIKALPSVTPQPKTGHWIHFAASDDCSECRWSTGKYISPSKYCPNCGAKMVEPQESEE